jgi:hypothetical protein
MVPEIISRNRGNGSSADQKKIGTGTKSVRVENRSQSVVISRTIRIVEKEIRLMFPTTEENIRSSRARVSTDGRLDTRFSQALVNFCTIFIADFDVR